MYQSSVLLFILFQFASLSAMAAELSVFVTVPPQLTFVERIGGAHVDVRVMVEPGQNPVSYEPSPRLVIELSDTDLYLSAGVPFEAAWLPRIRATNPRMQILESGQWVDLVAADHAGATGHHEGMDPHFWTNPRLVIAYTEGLRDLFVELLPEYQSEFEANYDQFRFELEQLDKEIGQLLAGIQRRKFLVLHPAWGYFAARYNLQQLSVEHEGKEPGARALSELIDQVRRSEIGLIIMQPQFSQKFATTIAQAVGARLATADPLSADYRTSLRQIAQLIAEDSRQ